MGNIKLKKRTIMAVWVDARSDKLSFHFCMGRQTMLPVEATNCIFRGKKPFQTTNHAYLSGQTIVHVTVIVISPKSSKKPSTDRQQITFWQREVFLNAEDVQADDWETV